MKTKDFTFELPQRLIAQSPLDNRLDSRMLVMDKRSGATRDSHFSNLHTYLKPGDVLVLNDTKVIPARLIGLKETTHATIEVLLLRDLGDNVWETLVKKAKKIDVGTMISFGEGKLTMECVQSLEEGIRHFKLHFEGILYEILDELGTMPLPPYIQRTLDDPSRYQTVYSKHEGSAAAPTAGLHFTQDYLAKLKDMGIIIVTLTLHVGLGTFRPIKVDDPKDHTMHSEFYRVSEAAAEAINTAKGEGRRIIPVGTTSLRTLETVGDDAGVVHAGSGMSDIFIYPGYPFKVIDALITNFHLPQSTLIMLVSALGGRHNILNAYEHAVESEYRFFSFGDAMFITDTLFPKKD